MLVYGVNKRVTFDEIEQFVTQVRRVKDRDSVPTIIIGNKIDLEHDRQVATSEGETLAKSFRVPFIETSAKTRKNVDEAFNIIVREIRKENKASNRKSMKKRINCKVL